MRKTEVIIRESNPVPLPPDVIRSSEKSSLGLEDLEKRNNRNIRNRFENGWNEKMAKLEEDEDDSEFENDENELGENESRKPKFSQMTEFREKFENGTKEDLKEERRESRKMELQNIRSRLFFGKQARIKEMYQQAVKDSSESEYRFHYLNLLSVYKRCKKDDLYYELKFSLSVIRRFSGHSTVSRT